MAQKIPLHQRDRRLVTRDRAERQREQRRGDLRIHLLVRLHVPVLEVEERLPPDEPPRRAESAAQITRIDARRRREIAQARIEDEAEERFALIAEQIRNVGEVGGCSTQLLASGKHIPEQLAQANDGVFSVSHLLRGFLFRRFWIRRDVLVRRGQPFAYALPGL